MKHIPH